MSRRDDLPATPESVEDALDPDRRSVLSGRQKAALSLAVLVLGLALLAPPVLGDGPDDDTVYRYQTVTVDPGGRSVGVLVALPDAAYVYGDVAETVVAAENGTVERTTAEAGSRELIETLEDVRFVRESGENRFYRVDLRVEGQTVRLDSERVTGRTVVEAFAVTPDAAPSRVRDLYERTAAGDRTAAEGRRTLETRRPLTPVLLDTPDGYVAVVPTGRSVEPDPLATEKTVAMGLGLVLTFAGAVAYTRT